MARHLVEHRQVWPETVFVDCRVPSEVPRLAGTTPPLGTSPDGCGPSRSQGRSPHEKGWRLRDEEGWRLRADSRRRPRLRLRPVASVVRLRSTCRTSTGVSNPQLGQSLVSSAVLHLTNDEWRLNHSAFGSFLGQVSSVHVTASSRWTPTVPEHSRNDIACIVPPRRAAGISGISTMETRCPRNAHAHLPQPHKTRKHSLREVTRDILTGDKFWWPARDEVAQCRCIAGGRVCNAIRA